MKFKVNDLNPPPPTPRLRVRRYWLVTIGGYDSFYANSHTAVSCAIYTFDNNTPIEWFARRPTVYFRFDFKPTVLYNYWEISKETYQKIRKANGNT